ncbi:MAG: chemotaxis protein CheW [Pseudomonadota bacterium]
MKSGGDRQRQHTQLTDLADSNNEFFSYLDTLLAEVDPSPEKVSGPQTKVTTPSAATYNQEQSNLHEDVDLHSGAGPYDGVTQTNESDAVARIPGWAKAPFQVLMFEVCGVTLAVPLISLTGILKLSGSLCQLPGQPVWHIGVLTNRSQKIVAVDTARLIMPERIDPERAQQAIPGSHLLLIGEGDFGLLIDKIKTTVKMDKGDVRWRHDPGQRSWLAGIIIGQLSVLLNVDALLVMIQEA